MDIRIPAKAGTMESSDIYIMVYPNKDGGISVDLNSIVMKQFGEQIRQVILETLKDLKVKDIHLVAKDRGALDYTIRARVETAVRRAV
ncbi:citrate lyase acyl carrier protein [Clostridiaceae bacterium 35-E11]